MARPPRLPIVAPRDGLVSAVERLQRAGLDGLPVVEDGRLVGVLTRRSIGLAVQARTAAERPGDPGSATEDPSDAGPEDDGDHDADPDDRDADPGDHDADPDGNPGSTPGAPA
jgi:hypothetical protein